jgi:hypothetical protein
VSNFYAYVLWIMVPVRLTLKNTLSTNSLIFSVWLYGEIHYKCSGSAVKFTWYVFWDITPYDSAEVSEILPGHTVHTSPSSLWERLTQLSWCKKKNKYRIPWLSWQKSKEKQQNKSARNEQKYGPFYRDIIVLPKCLNCDHNWGAKKGGRTTIPRTFKNFREF